jgi:hypothetical protein
MASITVASHRRAFRCMVDSGERGGVFAFFLFNLVAQWATVDYRWDVCASSMGFCILCGYMVTDNTLLVSDVDRGMDVRPPIVWATPFSGHHAVRVSDTTCVWQACMRNFTRADHTWTIVDYLCFVLTLRIILACRSSSLYIYVYIYGGVNVAVGVRACRYSFASEATV